MNTSQFPSDQGQNTHQTALIKDTEASSATVHDLYIRAEKIAAGIILITKHIDNAELLKHDVKKVSLQLLEVLGAHAVHTSADQVVSATVALSQRLATTVKLLSIASFVSEENARLLSSVIESLIQQARIFASTSSSLEMVLNESSLNSVKDILTVSNGSAQSARNVRPSSAAESAGTSAARASHATESGPLETEVVFSASASSHINVPASIPLPVPTSSNSKSSTSAIFRTKPTQAIRQPQPIRNASEPLKAAKIAGSRGDVIASVLATAGKLGIRSIGEQLPAFSAKMIQRELAALVAEGRVSKTGEKRWSEYELIVK
jgi:hypothetical protein